MKRFRRVVCIVLDGVGVGAAPDAADYGDAAANSVANTARAVGALRLPNLERFGLGRLCGIAGVEPVADPAAHFGRLRPAGAGKDSTTGHWELMGCVLDVPFPTYPNGFPRDVIDAFETSTGFGVIGNCPASGTEIIARLGDEHLRTGRLIVYTSQDSVFQIAAHEAIVPAGKLYEVCAKARTMLHGEHAVGRVIARPFDGESGAFFRTPRRRDFSLPPPTPTVLDLLIEHDKKVVTIGKIDELFAGRGVSEPIHTRDNADGMRRLVETLRADNGDFVFVNLVDFDTMWGHRGDARAYALGLEEFDSFLSHLVPGLREDDLLIVTADHGNDPTAPSSDHSREFVPLIVVHSRIDSGVELGTRDTLADVGATVADALNVDWNGPGESFCGAIVGD